MRRRAARVAAWCLGAWALSSAAVAADEGRWAAGRRLFTQEAVPACAVCHTLKDAGTEGAVGPVLDELKPSPERVTAALRNGIGVMPSYRTTLTPAQIETLARYVSEASGGAAAAAAAK